MIRKQLSLVILSLCFFFTKVISQEYLTLEECRDLAIQNNKNIQMATQEERVAYYNKQEALSNFLPEVSFKGMYMRNQKELHLFSSSIPSQIPMPNLPTIPGVNLPPAGTPIDISQARQKLLDLGTVDIRNIWVGGFSLTQPLFMGGKIIAYNDLRSYAQELAKTMKDTKLTDVIVQTDDTYWQVVSLASKKQLAQAYVDLLKQMTSDITEKENEGMATKADRLSVEVKLNEAEMTLTKATNGLSLAKMLLCQICGMEITDKIKLKDEDIESLNISPEPDVMPDVNEALANRDELKSLELLTKISKKQSDIERAGFLPSVGLIANYLWMNPNSTNGFQKKFDGSWSVGVSASVPLSFWKISPKYKAAKVETLIKKLELADAKENITLEVNQSAYKLAEANKKLIMTKKNAEKADENLKYANNGFDEGVIPASDALSAHTAWISAHADMIDAQIDVKLCRIYLDKALGRKIK